MKQVLLALALFVTLTSGIMAQDKNQITDKGDEKTAPSAPIVSEPIERAPNVWSDPLFYQFENMMPGLAQSLGRLESRVSTLAVTRLRFSHHLDDGFRKVAQAKFYGQLLLENPRLKLIKCDECSMLRSEVKNGILTISRGISNKEERRKLAQRLKVQAFMNVMVIEENRQLSVVINIYDAEEGRIILSDVVAGVPAPKSSYYNIFAGQMQVPILLIDGEEMQHLAMVLGVEKVMRFYESWMLGASFALYQDNNEKLDEGHQTFTSGAMFDGTVGWEMLSMMNNNISFALILGMGEFISTQFNFSIYQKVGLKITINQILTFNYYALSFDPTNMEAPVDGVAPQLTGSAKSLTFGFQF